MRDVFGSPGELIKRGFCLPTADPPSTQTAAVVSCNDTIAGLSNSTLSQARGVSSSPLFIHSDTRRDLKLLAVSDTIIGDHFHFILYFVLEISDLLT